MEEGFQQVNESLTVLLRNINYETEPEIESGTNSNLSSSNPTPIAVTPTNSDTSADDDSFGSVRPMRKKSVAKGHRRSRSVDHSSIMGITKASSAKNTGSDSSLKQLSSRDDFQPPPKMPKSKLTSKNSLHKVTTSKEEPIKPALSPKAKQTLLTRTVSTNTLTRKRSTTSADLESPKTDNLSPRKTRRKSPPPSVKLEPVAPKKKLSFRITSS